MFFFRRRKVRAAANNAGLTVDIEQVVQLGVLGSELWHAMQKPNARRSQRALRAIRTLLEAHRVPRNVPSDGRTVFQMDALFLQKSFLYVCSHVRHQRGRSALTPGFKEVFHYCTGMPVGGRTFVLGHIVPVKFSQQTAGGVRVADESNIEALASLDRWGLPLVAHFHSHPGSGVNANCPSPTDLSFQERLERGGHIAIGGIFSRDGFLRFFAGDSSRFEVRIHGHHVQEVAKNVYRVHVADGDLPIADSESNR